MKKYIFIFLAAFACMFWSCKESDNQFAAVPVSTLTAESRIEAVLLKWTNPEEEKYYYSTVTYFTDKGEEVTMKVSKYSEDAKLGSGYTSIMIPDLKPSFEYEFFVTPYTTDGDKGVTECISCVPENTSYAYKYIAETSVVTPIVQGAKIEWTNEYEQEVELTVSFENVNGEEQTVTIDASESGSEDVYAFADPTTLTIVSANPKGELSEPTEIECEPLKGEIPQVRMSVAEVSSETKKAPAENLLDTKVETLWKTKAEDEHWFTVEFDGTHMVNWVELVRGKDVNEENAPSEITIEYSVDGKAYKSAGTFEFDPTLCYNHTFNFDPVKARFVRVSMDTEAESAVMAEFLAYYGDQANHYADEGRAELAPDPDEDPTYYPEIDYLVPDKDLSATFNNVSISYPNEENPSEFIVKTTGGDPYFALSKLKAPAAGTVLVFQYKMSETADCEFFWCPGGYGVGGPAGGKETHFDVTKSDEWKVFKKNMASAFSSFGWGSAANDQVRFDVGNGGGITLQIRNMHFREAVEGE